MKPPSKRFQSSGWSERLVPLFLMILVIGLLVTIGVVILAVIGLTPGS